MNMTANHPAADMQFLPTDHFSGIAISDAEFSAIRQLVYDNFGINLTDQKKSLVVGRLQKFMRTKRFASFDQYLNYVKTDTTGQALGELVNRISTNHTFFFREQDHFDFLRKTVLPETMARLTRGNSRDIRFWCAGCSFGDEPYTFIITMMEHFGIDYRNWNAGLLATDISTAALAGAKAAVYTDDRLKLVPPQLKQKYFIHQPDGSFRVKDTVKSEVTFRRFNLMNQNFPFKKPFHLISCRNVMIYFDEPTRKALVERFYHHLVPGGYLFIGHSETLRKDDSPFDYVKPAIYRKGGV